MAYFHDAEARSEAAKYQIHENKCAGQRDRCQQESEKRRTGGVRSHTICFSVEAWDDLASLPDRVSRGGRISRGDVFEVADQVRAEDRPALDLLLASFVWGWGPVAYGPRRYRSICRAAGDDLEPALQRALAATTDGPEIYDQVAGYAQFYGGNDRRRARPGQAPWSRLRGLGPAFFTKFLHFSTPGALVLDNRLAVAVHGLSEMPFLVTDDNRAVVWTPFRYAVYLHWMRQTAEVLGVNPQLLELTLFNLREQ